MRAEGAESGANAPQNQWAAVAVAHQMALKKPSSFIMVGDTGIEPVAFCVSSKRSTTELITLVVHLFF